MSRLLLSLLVLLAVISTAAAQTPNFPQTLPPNTVVGRGAIPNTGGPAQAIPNANFAASIAALIATTTNTRLDQAPYNVKCDGVTDNSALIQTAITDANAAGGVRTLVFPKGTCLAPTLAATITGVHTFLACDGGPGACILKGGVSGMLTWSGSFGGMYNMGLDNSGAATNVTIAAGSGANSNRFENIFLGAGIGVLFQQATLNAGAFMFDGLTGSVSCTPAAGLFVVTTGASLQVRNSNIGTNCANGSAVSGRSVFTIGGGGNFDTLISQNNLFFNFDTAMVVVSTNGTTVGDIFSQGNIYDVMNNGFDFVSQAGGQINNLYLDDPWLGVYVNGASTAGACMIFQGAGQIIGVHISSRLPICAGSGISASVTTATDWLINNVSLTGGNASNLGGTAGLLLNGSNTVNWNNITVTNSRFSRGISSANPLGTGCQTSGVINKFVFSGNDCEGTTNYSGMITGTAVVKAHTNSKQVGNVGLADSVDQLTFATLPANPQKGSTQTITDGLAANCGDTTCTTFHTNVTGGTGALPLVVQWNGANWKLINW